MTRLLILAAVSLATPERADLFRDRVAPLLSARCLACHDNAKKRGGLDLSTHATALRGGESGPALVPGSAARSKLVAMVSGKPPLMPRLGSKLTPGEVASLREWIDAGAGWPSGLTLKATRRDDKEAWWSLRAISLPPVPPVKRSDWPRNPVDRFILARLEKEGLAPSAEATRAALLRRACFDLTGLPPTLAQLDAFLADARPDAYERLIDGLLASPAYGERWGRHWLDVARYADTHGYDKDKRRNDAWPYRDWVIKSLNADLPWRDFVRLQIAGDVLKPGDPDGVAASGFVVAGPWDFVGHVELREGTVDKLKTRVNDRDDMLTSALGTFASVTVGCARCHDHKFDPIPMRDYYRLQAVFAGVERGSRRVAPPDLAARRKALEAQQADASRQLRDLEAGMARLTGPEVTRTSARIARARAELASLKRPAMPPSRTNGYHSAVLPTSTPAQARWVQVDLGAVLSLDEVRLFPARPVDFPDTPGFGFPVRFRVEASEEPTFRKPILLLDKTTADVPNPGDNPYRILARGKKARYVRVTATRLWKRTGDYVFALAEVQVLAGGKLASQGKPVSALDSIEAGRWAKKHLVDGATSRRVLPAASSPAVTRRLALLDQLRADEAARAAAIEKLVPPARRARRAALVAQIAGLDAKRKALAAAGPTFYAVRSIPPRPVHLLRRGDVEQPVERVTPGALSCVAALRADFPAGPGEGARRVALADWLAHDKNPLVWRSIANRLWHWHFGRGIVDTPSDFGKMGSPPTHLRLLDWLAWQLRASGGSLKEFHRLLVTSATYRQASRDDTAASRLDSDNRLLWRAPRRKLDAEELRDAVLAASGVLRQEMGGAGFDLFRFKDDHSPVYDHDDIRKMTDPSTFRRTVYRFAVRSVPNPFLECLDSPDPNQPVPVRTATLTALQALAMMNNPFMVEQASRLAARLRASGLSTEGQVTLAYRLLFSRRPSPEERRAVAVYAEKHGLAAACRVLLNANEFVFVD